jgi:hypothetical protein
MVSGAGGGVCRLDDTRRVALPTLRSTTQAMRRHSFVGGTLDPGVKLAGCHINGDNRCAASLNDEESRASERIRSS